MREEPQVDHWVGTEGVRIAVFPKSWVVGSPTDCSPPAVVYTVVLEVDVMVMVIGFSHGSRNITSW